jgi:hypothetical protein
MRFPRLLIATLTLKALTAAPAMADDSPGQADGTASRTSEPQAQAEANDLSPQEARLLQGAVACGSS